MQKQHELLYRLTTEIDVGDGTRWNILHNVCKKRGITWSRSTKIIVKNYTIFVERDQVIPLFFRTLCKMFHQVPYIRI